MSPTKKQMDFADAIAKALGINFPESSTQFTKNQYRLFISEHVKEYYDTIFCYNDDWKYEYCDNDYDWGFLN